MPCRGCNRIGSALLLPCSFLLQPRQVGRGENKGEGNPGSEDAREHRQTFLDQESDNENIHENHRTQKRNGSLKRTAVVEFPKVDARERAEHDRCTHGMNNQSVFERGDGSANAHDGATEGPADEGKGEKGKRLGA